MSTESAAISVLIVEDDAVHGVYLTDAVLRIAGAKVSAWLKRAAELRRRLADATRDAPDLVLLDLGLPDGSGVTLVREIRERWPETRILVVSVLTDERSVVDAIRSGASGYVLKDGDGAAVTASIRNVLDGQNPISPGVARYLISFVTSSSGPTIDTDAAPESQRGGASLTPREVDILHKIAEGMSYLETAEALGVTRSTVESHIRNLYRKLEAHSKTQALVRAREHGLL
jgi:DNA-binding NarL/FixJ family response regulator